MKFSIRLWALLSLWVSLFAAGPLRAQTGTDIAGTIKSGGQTRQYHIYVPKSYQQGTPVPLLFNLHGRCYGLGDFRTIADSENFLIVQPDGLSDGECIAWNTFEIQGRPDDVGFISDLLTQLQAQYSVDAQRVYAAGLSNGGFLSHVLAAQLSTRIAAIGSNSGGMVPEMLTACAPVQPVPVLEIHGQLDPTIPPLGGGIANAAPLADLMAKWAQVHGCAPKPDTLTLPHDPSTSKKKVRRSVWKNSSGTGPVVLYEVINGGHEWAWGDWDDIDAATEIWHFLRQFRLPAAASSSPNLALNKPVSSSSLEWPWLPSSGAVDGNPDTRWSSNFTDSEWLTIDLGARYAINRVKLSWHANIGKNYNIEVSDDAVNWTIIRPVQDNTNMAPEYTNLTGTGRYVRLNGKARGTQWGYSLYEFEVYGTPAPLPNLALNKPVTTSSVESTILLGPGAVDGNAATRWSSNFTDTEWLYVDLGARYNVNEVKLTWETAYGKTYNLEVSDDAVTWTPLKKEPNNSQRVADYPGLTGTGRYVRLNGTARGTQWGYSLFEFAVYGTLATTPNLALGQPVRFSSVKDATVPGSAAVDGTPTTRWSSAFTDDEWLYVDLGGSYNVNEVKVSWEAAFGKDYTIDISDDANQWRTIKNVSGNTFMLNDLTGFTGPTTGHYVRLKGITRGTPYGYSLLEFEVYGTPVFTLAAGGVYELEPQSAIGQRLDVYGLNTANGATVTLYARSGNKNQQWQFIDKGNNTYELAPQHAPGQRLDVYNQSTADNALVSIWSSNGNSNQQWKATAIGGGIYEFEPQCAGGKRLDTGVINSVTQTVSKTQTGVGSQRWRLYPVSTASTPAAKVLAQSAVAADAGTLSVFPNPVTTTPTVTLSGVAAYPATAEVYDAQGIRLSSVPLTQASDGLNVSKLPMGLYTIRISSAQTVQTVRLQKN